MTQERNLSIPGGLTGALIGLAAELALEEITGMEVVGGLLAVIGAGFDSALVNSGWVSYASGQFSAYIAPYWIITMWMLFATTLNVSMRWMRGKPVLAAVFGLIGGPAAYLAGQKLGGIILVERMKNSRSSFSGTRNRENV